MPPGLFIMRGSGALTRIRCSPMFNQLFHARPMAVMDPDTHDWIIPTSQSAATKQWLQDQGHIVTDDTTTPKPIPPYQPPGPRPHPDIAHHGAAKARAALNATRADPPGAH